ncbi:MAG: PLP-dependent transferase [Thermoanaerobaculales bacterium]|jgi:O-acetylhomoserine/O-acetylserine sulfhydrylase-like pyridoxal-dependent enzyme|nr:PLP-dependent transferase [Thermoanaerobaculales bacterium]
MTTATINGVDRYIAEARETMARRAELRARVRRLRFDTIAVHGMYGLEEAFSGGQGGIVEPIFPSTSQAYRDSDEMEAALSYRIPTWCYSRIHNPTVFYLEETLALLESYGCSCDATGLATSSGMAAIKQAVEPLLANPQGAPLNFVSTAQVYGGTFQLFNLRMAERGARVRWVTEPWRIETWEPLIDEHTRFLYAEMPSNPQQACTDLEAAAELAHRHGIPLIVDATVATPALMRPLAHGADIVVHSLSKTAGTGGNAIAGGIVARHGIVSRHLDDEQRGDYALWLKLWPFRDSGPCMTATTAHYLLSEMRTLRLKMAQMSRNTLEVARYLAGHPRVERVDYLGLESHPLHRLASRYLKVVDDDTPAYGHLMSFTIRGSAADARTFFDGLGRIFRATDLGRIKSVATIPAISTHQQQGEEGRKLAGIPPTMVRLCVGAEHPQDTIDDLDQALARI